MNAIEIINSHQVQEDPSGVGHAWRPLDTTDFSADIAEEIACWIIEDGPGPSDEMTATDGQHYRLPPE